MIRPVFDSVRRIGKIAPGSIRAVLDYVIPRMNDPMPEMDGFGIVTVAGGAKYLRLLWASVKKTRMVSDAPIWCFHLGPKEIQHWCVPMLEDLGVHFVDAIPFMKAENYQSIGGWSAKSIAIMHSPFQRVCFLDADAFALIDPEEIEFPTGFMAFRDVTKCRKNDMLFPNLGLKRIPDWVEFEAGQQLWDKKKTWRELQLFSFMNGRKVPFHDLTMGDKDLAPLSFMKLGTPFDEGGIPEWLGYGIRHHLSDGTPAFLHFMPEKRGGPVAPEVVELLREFDQLTLQPA